MVTLFPDIPIGKTISKSFVGKRSTSSESIEFGKINSSGFLSEEMWKRSQIVLDNIRSNQKPDSKTTIIAMGPVSAMLLTGKPIKEVLGRSVSTTEFGDVYCMMHPDTMITDKFRSEMWKRHWVHALSLLQSETQSHLKSIDTFIPISSINDLNETKIKSADIELKSDRIDMIGFSDGEEHSIMTDPEPFLFKDMIESEIKWIFHNATHDIEHLNTITNENLENLKVSDTMLIAKCLYPLMNHDLDSCERELLNKWKSWKQLNHKGK